MDIEERQYDRFISQLRVEVDQTFWLYNFFFAINSALFGTFFLGKIYEQYSLVAIITGLVLSIFWVHIMNRKDEWRRCWLDRIREIEKRDLKISEKLQMWPRNLGLKPGLWRALFLLPKGFIILWFAMLFLLYWSNLKFWLLNRLLYYGIFS